MKRLFFQAVSKFLLGGILVGAVLFVPAGSLRFWNAWLLMGILFLSMPLVLGSLYSFLIMLLYIPFVW